jgi:hypothetical protein
MRGPILLFASVTLACSTVPTRPTPVQGADDHLIVPGKRVGRFAIGAAGADLLRDFGRPTKSYSEWDVEYDTYGIGFRGEPQWVYSIFTHDRADHTEKGLRIGSVPLEVRSQLGKADNVKDFCPPPNSCVRYAECYDSGITFGYGDDGSGVEVESIQIVPPNTCSNL